MSAQGESDMIRFLERLRTEETGQDLVEYSLLAAFLAMVSVAGLRLLGPVIAGFYQGLIPLFGI
jgi:Flp pilus assembly pilin Flp